MSTLTHKALLQRLSSRGKKRLCLTPLLSQRQIGDASIDVRLGNQFIVFRMHRLESYPGRRRSGFADVRRIQERHVLRYGETFVLHPGALALASTLEYLSMPADLECQVEGRSSWARVGLEVATATAVEPGFRGVVTLELSNVGTVPLSLSPGLRISQLVFREAAPAVRLDGRSHKYHYSVGPEFSRLEQDPDLKVFMKEARGSDDDGTSSEGP